MKMYHTIPLNFVSAEAIARELLVSWPVDVVFCVLSASLLREVFRPLAIISTGGL
jgi:hypothetical protein